jgi:Domain of unknown function (DUF4157)
VVFAPGQYQPSANEGRRVLGHELTHVVQQTWANRTPKGVSHASDSQESMAEAAATALLGGQQVTLRPTSFGPSATVSRLVSSLTRCPPNANGAPADPATELGAMDTRAGEIATTAADLARASPPSAATLEAYENRFGLPPAVGRGFLNRLTGRVAPSQEAAIAAEMAILSRRYRIVARTFSQPVVYRCGAGSFGGCDVSVEFCNDNFAGACRGVGAIFLCPDFWSEFPDTDSRALVLVHEAFHVNFGTSDPRQTGEIGDEELRGAGRNFVLANCYEGFAADLAAIDFPEGACPAPP